MRKYVSEIGKRCDTYKSLITSLSEDKTKEDVEGFYKTHPSRKYRTIWEFLGIAKTGNLVTYKGKRILIPRAARKSVMMVAHNEHTGAYGVSHKIRRYYYWPQLNEDVRNFLGSCKECNDWGEVD